MTPFAIERRPTPHYFKGREGNRPRGIVVHTTSGSAESASSWFADPSSGVSAHYLVGLDGQVGQFVDEEDTARHAGRVRNPTAKLIDGGDPNLYTVGVEFEDGGDPNGVERTDLQYRAGGLLLARIAQRWEIPLDREHVIGHREVFSAKDCPGNLDLDRLLEEAGRALRPTLVCLLPARNAAGDLPGWFGSTAAVADAVVALDDGSSDETRELLERNLLVQGLLTEPPRDDYAEWDDAANRQDLLDAAEELDPGWILFLDADERIDHEDAEALRRFIETDALPGCAYGLQLFRTWGEQVVPEPTNVYRLFSYQPDAVLPDRRLHFNPVPEQIPRAAWIETTVRVRHLDSPERLRDRRGKYDQADPQRTHELRPARLLGEPDRTTLEPWQGRDPALPVLAPAPAGGGQRERRESRHAPARCKLLCLLAVKEGEEDLPGYLESAARFADGVIALDDGSADRTAELLEESDLVLQTIRNPVRPDYRDWDEPRVRATLLEAAAEIRPAWVMWLDVDERIDADDAAALRSFLEREADPACAYGFRVFRMIGDTEHYDRAGLWVYRLFAPASAPQLASERLHAVFIPRSIPRRNWRKTTIRIQHLSSLTEERRLARYRKYEQADPDRTYQADYSHLLEVDEVKTWRPRPDGMPVLADPLGRGTAAELDLETIDLDAPLLSAIVIARNDEDWIERAVRSVVRQECPEPFEVIVVVSGEDRTAEIVRSEFPEVKLIELEGEALPGRSRNAGVDAARGDYVSFPGSHVELPQGSLAARLAAHELGYPMVTGSILNGTETLSGWASYFLDHSGSLPGRPSGELAEAPAHCSYAREFLHEVGGFPEELRAGEDTVVNRALFGRGHAAYRAQDVTLVHRSRCSNPWRLVRHHFGRGRGWGRILVDDHRGGDRLLRGKRLRFLALGYVPRRINRTRIQVAEWGGDLRGRFRRAFPLVVGGTVAAWIGLWIELLRPGRGKPATLLRDQRSKPPG